MKVVRRLPMAILCAAVMTMCNLSLAVAGDTDTIRLVSYNIHHCEGMDGKVNCERTASAILREKPDFVGIQEIDRDVPRSGRADQPTELARLTGMYATFAKAIPYRGGEYGVAVLSREQPLSVRRTPLPGPEPRVLLLCEFTNCWFGSTHLDARKRPGDTEPCHVLSARIIREEVAKCAATKPVFLTGDWNTVPDSPAHAEMCTFMKVVSDEKKPTNGNLRRVIDYITVDAAHAGDFQVQSADVTIDHMTSDHKPVIVSLKRIEEKRQNADHVEDETQNGKE